MGDLDIRGGAVGVSAQLDDLHRAAAMLDTLGDRLRSLAAGDVRLATRPGLLASLAISPRTGARAVSALHGVALGPRGLVAVSVQVELTSRSVRAAVRAYELVDAASAALLQEIQHSAGFGIGFVGGALGPPVALVLGGAALLADQETPLLPGADEWLDGLIAPIGLGDALGQLGRDADEAWRAGLFRFPWVTDAVTGGAPDLVVGLAAGGGPLVRWGFLALSASSDVPWPPRTYEEAAALVIATGRVAGAFEDGAPVQVRQIPTPAGAAAPASVADVLRRQSSVMAGDRARVRVVQVPQPEGASAWLVVIPGTQNWAPVAGDNPFDLSGNLHLMAGDSTSGEQAVTAALQAAMDSAGVPAGQPVMLTGHSQGGIIAAALSASPTFQRRFHVTTLVVSGAPIARMPVPESVSVLALENEQDLVPRLEGGTNPDRPGWVTVLRDVSGETQDPVLAHDRSLYTRTAAEVDASDHPSLQAWRSGSRVFLRGQGVVRDYEVRRAVGVGGAREPSGIHEAWHG